VFALDENNENDAILPDAHEIEYCSVDVKITG